MQSSILQSYEKITDPKIIEELNKQQLYVAPNEGDETYDMEIVEGHNLAKSASSVGMLRPIEVAVWFDDPNKESDNSHDRVHLRIINGRHRYREDPNWERVYYNFSKFPENEMITQYYFARGHFDMQKKGTKEERKAIVVDLCKHFMKKGIPANQCCQKVVEKCSIQGIFTPKLIREVCPNIFKSVEHSERKKDKTFEKTGKDTVMVKEAKKIAGTKYKEEVDKNVKLQTELNEVNNECVALRQDNNKKTEVIDELQSKIRILSQLDREETCTCGRKTSIKVDASDNKILVTEKQ